MAKIVPTDILEKALKAAQPGQTAQDIIFFAGKALRLKILYDREFRGFNKADVNGPKDGFETSGMPQLELGKKQRENLNILGKKGRTQLQSNPKEEYTFEKPKQASPNKIQRDYITIVDMDFRDDDLAKRGYKKLVIPFVPRDISYEPQSKFVGIATMGRNNPFYQFTGSEDTIKFEIDWYALKEEDKDRKVVINSCRWVEALSKADGYTGAPHRVSLMWSQENLLFKDDLWIVVDAPYVLTQFVDSYREKSIITKVGLLPQQAIQTITLKRVTSSNRTSEEIIGKLRK
jgi:hypothetical protein